MKNIDVTNLLKNYSDDNAILTYNTENIIGMFQNCTGLTTVSGAIPNTVINLSQMFQNCTSLTTVDENFFNPNSYFTSANVYINQTFENCPVLSGNFNSDLLWNNLTVTFITDDTFNGCTSLIENMIIPESWK